MTLKSRMLKFLQHNLFDPSPYRTKSTFVQLFVKFLKYFSHALSERKFHTCWSHSSIANCVSHDASFWLNENSVMKLHNEGRVYIPLYLFLTRVAQKPLTAPPHKHKALFRLDCLHHVANEAFCFDELLSSSSVNTDICVINDLLHFTPSSEREKPPALHQSENEN